MSTSDYFAFLSRHYRQVVVACLLMGGVLAAGNHDAGERFSHDLRVYFSEDNPQLAAFERFERRFSRQDTATLLVLADEGEIFTAPRLEFLAELTEFAWRLPHVQRVRAMANHQHSVADGDTIRVGPLVGDAPLTEQRVASIRAAALAEPLLAGALVARDGGATAIVMVLNLPASNPRAALESINAARTLRDREMERAASLGLTVLIGGSAASNVTLAEGVDADMRTLVPASFLVIALGLLLLLRSLFGTVIIMTVVVLAVASAMGLFGWANLELTPVAGFVPSVVMTIAVADCVHVLATYFLELRRGRRRADALAESLRVNVQPVFLTTVTTIIGVLCLNLSDSPPYRDLGNMVALGTFFAWVFSMTFLPALLLWLPEPRPGPTGSASYPMQRFGEFVVRRHRLLFISMGALVVTLVSFVASNRLTDSWTDYFDESFELRQAIEAANTRLSGNHLVEFVLDSGESGGINDPAFLGEAGAFTDWLRAQPEVAHAAGLVDVLRQLNRNMHGDDPAWYRLPDRRELAAQYLLLYELSLPEGMGLDNLIDIDRSATRLTAVLYKSDSERILATERRARAWLAANTSSIRPLEGTSLDMVFAHISRRNIHGLLWGTALALVLISLVLVVALRSARVGLISLVPNLAPAALAYGTWGLLVGHIDLALSIVICMSLGIVVDDTVHFLSKYQRARRERNLAPAQAIPYAFATVGVALFTTSFVLVTGFAVLALSHMTPTRETGTLLSVTLSFALLADFLFLPPLLMLLDRSGPGQPLADSGPEQVGAQHSP